MRGAMPNGGDTAKMLDHIHCRAICDEIGERLRDVLGRGALEIPPRLLALVDQLAQLDQGPSIVPSFNEMSFPLSQNPFDINGAQSSSPQRAVMTAGFPP
jgi:hypothetical protein